MARTLTVYLAADTTRFRSGMRSAANSVDGPQGFGSRVSNLSSRLGNVLGPAMMGAGIAAGAFAVKMGVDGVKAAIDEEAEITKLATALANLGFEKQTAAVEEWISATARATTFSDSDLRPAMATLAGATGSVTTAQKLLAVAMDAAVGTGKPLDQVVKAIAKSVDGQTGALSKLIPGLDKATLKSGDLDAITGLLSQRFAGQAAGAAGTWAGKVGNVSEAFDELKEAFGAGFLGGMDTAGNASGDLTTTLYELQTSAKDLGTDLAELLTTVSDLVQGYNDVKESVEDFRDSIEGTAWGKIFGALEKAMMGPLNTANALLATLLAIAQEKDAQLGNVQTGALAGVPGYIGQRPETASQVPGVRAVVTEQQVGNAIYKILANTDARRGYVVGGVLQ